MPNIQKETEMYEEYADKALTGFKASIKWLKIVDRAMRMVLPLRSRAGFDTAFC